MSELAISGQLSAFSRIYSSRFTPHALRFTAFLPLASLQAFLLSGFPAFSRIYSSRFTPHALRFTAFLPLVSLLAFTLAGLPASPAFADTRTYQRSIEKYAMPDVTLINQDGNKVRFKNFLSAEKPVVVDFIFGTCTTICPVLSAGYASLQQKLGAGSEKVHLVSITIDPENDKPAVLKDYLKRYRSKPGWDFLTGSRKDIDRVMKAFNANIPDKMSHYALTFIRMPKEDSWVRINGMMSTSEFLAESQRAGIR